MANLHFDITGDNGSLLRSLQQAQNSIHATISAIEGGSKAVDKEMKDMGNSVEQTFQRIAKVAGGIFAAQQVKEYMSQVIDVRKEFQSIELSFKTLMGSEEAGKKLFQDITQFATTTPMLEKDLAKAAQTLLGFNIEANKVMPVLRQIGDISMGDSQKMESLTLAFAQASSTGKLMGQDLLQMINAGFNPLSEISRTTGRSMEDLKDAMSKGEISVEMLQNAFKTATDEGGKFHGMLNGMAQGMQGAFSNLEGAIQKFYNDAGQKIEGPLVEGANLATEAVNTLAENIDAISTAVQTAVIAFGAYKAAAMLLTASESAWASVTAAAQSKELEQLREVIAMKNAEVTEDGKVVVAKAESTSARAREIAAAREEMKATLGALQAKAKEAQANLVNARSEEALANAQLSTAERRIAMRELDYQAALKSGDAVRIETAETNLNVAAQERNSAAKAAKIATDKAEAAQLAANKTAKVVETATTAADTVATTADAAATGILTRAKLALSSAIDKVTLAMKSNPLTLIAIGLAALATVVWKVYDAYSAHIKHQEDLRKKIEETTKAGEQLKQTLKSLGSNAIKRLNEQTADTISKYKTLQAKWKACNGDARLQKRFINQNKNAFHDLGYEIDTVSAAEDFLVKNTSAVVAALEARARAAAYQELATEAYKQKILKQQQINNDTSKYRKVNTKIQISSLNQYEQDALRDAVNSGKLKHTKDLRKQATLTPEAAEYLNNYNNQRLLNRRKQAQQDLNKETDATINSYTIGAAKAEKEAEEAAKKVGTKEYKKPAYEETDAERKAREKQEKIDAKKAAKAAKEANKDAEDAQRLAEVKTKAEIEAARSEVDTIQATEQYVIDAMAEGHEKRVRQIELDNAKEIEAIKRAKEDAIAAHEEEAKALWEAEHPKAKDNAQTWENTGKVGKTFSLTKEEEKMFAEREKVAKASYERQIKAENIEVLKSRNEYLKEYGDYEEKKTAIHAEYEAKRAALSPDDEYGRKILDKQEESETTNLLTEKQKVELDWEGTFNDLERYTADYLAQLQTRLNEALNSATQENAELIKQKIAEIDRLTQQKKGESSLFGSNGFFGGSSWGQAAQAIQKQNGLELKAQQDKSALESQQKDILGRYKELDGMAPEQITSDNKNVTSTLSPEDLQKLQGLESTAGASAGASAGGQAATAVAVTGAIIHGVNDNIQSFTEAADMIWGEDSEMAKSVGKFAESSQYATEGFDKLKSGDFIGATMSVGKAVSSLGETFGIWSNSNRAEIEKENERLANAMSVNTEALNRLTKKMEEGTAADKARSYEQAKGTMQSNQQSQLQIMLNNARMYDGGHSLNSDFYDSYHGTELEKKMQRFFSGKNVSGLSEILSLDVNDINRLYETEAGRELMKELTQKMADAGDSGNYGSQIVSDWQSYLSEYSKEAYEELQNTFRQAVTGVSFDSFKDEFKSTLMDMDSDAKDFAKNMSKHLMESVLDSQMEKLYGQQIQDLYTQWNNALTNDSYLSDSEITALKQKQEMLTDQMLATRDKLAAITGYDDLSSNEVSGNINSAKSMSEDTANELVGRVTAVQLGVEGIKAQDFASNAAMAERLTQGMVYLTTVSNLFTRSNETLDSILQQNVIGNNYLAEIARYNQSIYEEWSDEIRAIRKKMQSL